MKIIKFFESTADGWPVLSTCLYAVVGEAFLDLDRVALALNGLAEQGPLLGG